MSTPKTKLVHHQKKQLDHIRYLNGQIEARQARVNNLAFRRQVLEKQKVSNYQSEYSRLRAHLEESSLPFQSRAAIISRTEHLKSLGAKAVSGIN